MKRLRLVVLAALVPASGRADEALLKAQERYQAGLERYKAQKYDEALKEFQAAYDLKPIPRVLINIGQTHQAMGNKAAALETFQQFLRVTRINDPERAAIEKQVADLAAAAPAAPEVEDELPAPEPLPEDRTERTQQKKARQGPAAITHTPVDEAEVGRAIPIVAEIPRSSDAVIVSLHYRNAGDADFARLALEPQGNAYVTAIPGRKVKGSAIQYYVEAHDAGGRVVAVSGTATNPHLVVISGGAAFSRRTAPAPRMSRMRKFFWAGVIATGIFLAAGTTTAALAKDRENALEARAEQSANGKGGPRIFDSDSADIESQGENFEAASVLAFVLGGLSAGAAGTFLYLDLQPPPKSRPRGAVVPLVLDVSF